VQTPNKLWDPITIWHTQEKPILLDRLNLNEIEGIKLHVVDGQSISKPLSDGYIKQLLDFDQRPTKP
jgi:hypothetical protein